MIRLLAGLMLLACLAAPASAGPDAAAVNSAEFKGKPPADDRIDPVVVKAQVCSTAPIFSPGRSTASWRERREGAEGFRRWPRALLQQAATHA
jgi:hypothetical protein